MKSGFELKVKNESRTALGAKRAELASLEFRFQAVDRYDQYPVLACGRTSCHSVFFMDCLFIWRYFGWEFHMSTGRDGRSISCLYGSRSEIFTHPSIGLWYSTITFIQDFSACRIFAIRPLLHISSMTGAFSSGLS